MKIITHIKADDKRLNILGSVIGQMSDGIWENTRSMEKYWKSLSYGKDSSGYLYLEDRNGVTTDIYEFFANKIKKIIQVEIEDGNDRLAWSRSCTGVPHYMHGQVTVGDCYELYELLKGRNTSKHSYATYSDYAVTLQFDGLDHTMVVSALNEQSAKQKALAKLAELVTINVRKV